MCLCKAVYCALGCPCLAVPVQVPLPYTSGLCSERASVPAEKSFRQKLSSNEVQTKIFPLQGRLKIKYRSKFKHLENIYRNLSFPFT